MLNQSWRMLAYIVPGVSLMALLVCMILTSYIDPAAEPSGKPKLKFDKSKHEKVIENGHCHVCQMDVQPRTRHCRDCNKCITRFDHHCFFMNTCIGGRNYRWFIATLVSAIIFFLLLETVALTLFTGYYTDRSIYRDLSEGQKTDEFMVFSQPLSHKGWLTMLGIYFAIGSVPSFFVTALFVYHDMSTHEYVMPKVEEKQEDEEKSIGCKQDKPNIVTPIVSPSDNSKDDGGGKSRSGSSPVTAYQQENEIEQRSSPPPAKPSSISGLNVEQTTVV